MVDILSKRYGKIGKNSSLSTPANVKSLSMTRTGASASTIGGEVGMEGKRYRKNKQRIC